MTSVAPLQNPDCSTRTPRGGHWRIAAARVGGLLHEECQDAYGLAMICPEVLVIAVADGAGSASHALLGASVAVRFAMGYLCARLVETLEPPNDLDLNEMLKETMANTRSALEAEATARHLTIPDLATTLILMIAGKEFVAAAQVGDGATVITDERGQLMTLTRPPIGKYVNEVTFLTSTGWLLAIQFKFWRGSAKHLAAFSDGLQFLCLKWPESAAHEAFFGPLFHFVDTTADELQAGTDLEQFLSSEKVRNRTNDDVTLVLASANKQLQ